MQPDFTKIHKIVILGCCGSGKSTLAHQLSQRTGIPAHHIDQMFWSAGWIERDKEEYKTLHDQTISGDRWIMDGNHSTSLAERLQRADLLIFLDYPLILCLYRIFKRVISSYGRVRRDMAAGCPERFDWEFIKDVLKFKKKRNPEILNIIRQNEKTKQTLIFTSPKDTKQFLELATRTTAA